MFNLLFQGQWQFRKIRTTSPHNLCCGRIRTCDLSTTFELRDCFLMTSKPFRCSCGTKFSSSKVSLFFRRSHFQALRFLFKCYLTMDILLKKCCHCQPFSENNCTFLVVKNHRLQLELQWFLSASTYQRLCFYRQIRGQFYHPFLQTYLQVQL